jgi:hypothetical protein
MSLPRLIEIGDSAVLTVASCVPIEVDDGPAVRFTFAESADDILTLPRMGVDGALLQMNLIVPGGGRGDEPVIDYAGLAGEQFRFSRGTPRRGTRPTWKIEKVLPFATPAPPVSDPRVSLGAVRAASEAAGGPTIGGVLEAMMSGGGTDTEEAKRAVIRAAYLRELEWVLDEPLKRAKKKKVELDINAAVAFLCIQQDRRRCL